MGNAMWDSDEVQLTAAQLAQRWRVSEDVLAGWRKAGVGPRWRKLGSRVMYPIAAVWAHEGKRRHRTAQTFIGVCQRHGWTFFRWHKAGKTKAGSQEWARRCVECGREREAARWAARKQT